MKTITRNTDSIAIYAGSDLALDATQATGTGWRDPNHTTANATLHTVGTLPENWTGGVWSYVGGVWVVADQVAYDARMAAIAATTQAALASARAALIKQIDVDTDAIYGAVQGNRGPEYVLAEAEATAFKDAGYTGTVPPSVASWASAKGWTATQSTDDILATAEGWRSAQAAIRATRLACKETARTANDFTAVKAQWAAFLVTIRAALGVV